MALLLGYHISLSNFSRTKRFTESVKFAITNNFSTFQIFTKNRTSKSATISIEDRDIEQGKTLIEQNKLYGVIHASYVINFGYKDANELVENVKDDLEFMIKSNCYTTVLHLTKLVGLSLEEAKANMKNNLEKLILEFITEQEIDPIKKIQLEKYKQHLISLEIMSGGGMGILSDFEPLGEFYKSLDPKVQKWVGFCVDTCHIYANGYDISTEKSAMEVFDKWNSTIGIDKIMVIHFNGSLGAIGTHLDRHTAIGSPYDQISQNTDTGIKYITSLATKNNIPMVFEVEEIEHFEQMKFIKNL
jgi:deoxyribonuclease IV